MSDALAPAFVRNWLTCRATLTHQLGHGRDVTVRKPRPEDQAIIAELRTQLCDEITLGQPLRSVAPALHNKTPLGLCITQQHPGPAFVDPHCIGWLGLGMPADTSRSLLLREFCISPVVRGLGIGRFALKMLLDRCDQVGLALDVAVSHLNPAKQLYLSLGFEVVGHAGPFAQLKRPPPRHSAR